ncbi:MAG: DUF4112 domain-containing protein [Gammaproteobacteria bacterium]|nr:DUF4112 domain-containing protein [Gammaproteobacteria bacterium]
MNDSTASRAGAPPPELLRLTRALTRALDSAVAIPGTPFRVGLDALLGLLPGLGDAVGAAMAGYLMLIAGRYGAPPSVLLRMLSNIGIDALIGAIPLAGDIFDIGWKANTRNLALLERHLAEPRQTRASSRAFVGCLLAALALVAAGGLVLAVLAVLALLRAVGGPT